MRSRTLHLPLLALALAAAPFLPAPAGAEPAAGWKLYYQGVLTDLTGAAASEPVDLRFELFAAREGGEPFWREDHPGLQPVDGRFGVYLGEQVLLDPARFAAGPVWLGITVGQDEELGPRQEVAATAYALLADAASSCDEAKAVGGLLPEQIARAEHTHAELHTHDGTAWTERTDGAGSGLDADLLDGLDTAALLEQATAQCLEAVEGQGYARAEELAAVATTGRYADLAEKPDIELLTRRADELAERILALETGIPWGRLQDVPAWPLPSGAVVRSQSFPWLNNRVVEFDSSSDPDSSWQPFPGADYLFNEMRSPFQAQPAGLSRRYLLRVTYSAAFACNGANALALRLENRDGGCTSDEMRLPAMYAPLNYRTAVSLAISGLAGGCTHLMLEYRIPRELLPEGCSVGPVRIHAIDVIAEDVVP